jgi:hypothetical protein
MTRPDGNARRKTGARRHALPTGGRLVGALGAAALAVVVGLPAQAGDNTYEMLRDAGAAIARELIQPIAACVARQDTGHDVFHGCLDWHSAVHGTWALIAYARMTGDTRHEPLVARSLSPGRVARERALLRAEPEFEMPYGRAWFLRLAREHETAYGDGALRPMAEDVLASLMAYYGRRPPAPRTGSYRSDSWALINMLDYAAWSHNAAALQAIRGWVQAHFVTYDGACDYGLEAGHFMAVCTNWAWLVSKVLDRERFDGWAAAFFARPGLPRPVTWPVNWHHHGLNFSRAWGLWGLYAASGQPARKQAYLDAYVAHVRATYEKPSRWRGSYEGVAHWVPQFGMLALQPLLAVERSRP